MSNNTADEGAACAICCQAYAGGIEAEGIDVAGTMTNSSVVGNTVTTSTTCGYSCGSAGGGEWTFGISISFQIEASILAESGPGANCSGGDTDAGYNIDDDGSCGFSGTSTSGSTTFDATLGPLANNGGPTKTVALLEVPASTRSSRRTAPPPTSAVPPGAALFVTSGPTTPTPMSVPPGPRTT